MKELWSKTVEVTCLAWRQQHSLDLLLYQSSHQEWMNRWLHSILIPLECGSAFLFVAGILRKYLSDLQLYLLLVGMIGFGMGMISLCIAPSHDHPWAGIASFVFLVAAPWASCVAVQQPLFANHQQSWRVVGVALVMWIMASSLQVVVGHWLWEQNSPDVLSSSDQVSWLSLTHSVQIAWSQSD